MVSKSNYVRHKTAKEQFASKCINVHGDLYDYSEVVYVTARIKVKVRCGIHGVWETTPDNHLRGTGCPSCGAIRANNLKASDEPMSVYYLKVEAPSGAFVYKIGVTSRSVQERYKQEHCEYETLWEHLTTGIVATSIETALVNGLNRYKYNGLSPFRHTGTSEVFKEDIYYEPLFVELRLKLKEDIWQK